MSDLTLIGLRVLLEVAQRGSFTAAAEALGYTQSAVSRQIAATEDAVGATLFDRQARGVRLTPTGEALARHARRVVAEVSAAELEVAGLRDRIAGTLAVGAYPTAAAALMPRSIALAQRSHPALRISLTEAGSPLLMQRLHAGRIEVAVVAAGDGLPAPDLAGVHAEAIGQGWGLGVAVGSAHPLAGREQVGVDEIAEEPWIVGEGSDNEPQFGAWPTLASPRIAHQVRSWQTRLGFVAAGIGISVVPTLAAPAVPRNVTWLRVDDPGLEFPRRTLIVTAPDPSPRASAFVAALRAVASGSPR